MRPGALVNRRIRLLLAALALAFGGIFLRAVWIQGVRAASLSRLASSQHRETVALPASRGTLYDRLGSPLAIGEQATTVYADPKQIVDAHSAALDAGRALGVDPATLQPRLGGFPGSASTPRSGARTRRAGSPRRCSGLPASTTGAWTG